MRRTLLIFAATAILCAQDGRVALAPDGWFRTPDGTPYFPLGGFHGNVLPLSRLDLSAEERQRVEQHIWPAQKTDEQGHVDLFDASDEMMDRWFRRLAADGTTALRLFARARVGGDVLDLCGKLNPELKQVFHRTFQAAGRHGIRVLLQILPEPGSMCYSSRGGIERYALPRYSKEELEKLTPAQKRFLIDRERVTGRDLFTDPDVLACQKQYLKEALDWIAGEPQVFALEIYNEQGWSRMRAGERLEHVFTFPWEDEEIRWSAEIVRTIKQHQPGMPVTLSHPGFGVTGFDPLKWSKPAGVDFYSPHLYAGLGGEDATIDFAAVTGATAKIINAGFANFYGEWGVFSSPVPAEVKRFTHRDAIWLSLLSGQPGFLQWTYEFPDEYRWPAKVWRALPRGFSPERAEVEVEIGREYQTYHDHSRYSLYEPGKLFPGFPFNRQKQADGNLKKMLRAYQHSLDLGVPVTFTMDSQSAMPLDDFLAAGAGRFSQPIRALGGYQMTYLRDAKSPTWIVYLRKRKVQGYGRHFVGVPDAAPLEVALNLPRGQYDVQIINLTKDSSQTRRLEGRGRLSLAALPAAEDYALVIRRVRPRG